MPEVKITDHYAFGYLLSTLIAIKMHDKQIAPRMTRAILQISLTGIVLASFFGFVMTLWLELPGSVLTANTLASARVKEESKNHLMELIYLDKIDLYQGKAPNSFIRPLPHEIDSFQNGLKNLHAYRQHRDAKLLQQAAAYFTQVNYQTRLVQQRYIYLTENTPQRHWGIYVLDLEGKDGLLIEVPASLDEWGTIEAGAILFTRMQGGALAIAGSARMANKNDASDMLKNYQSFFQVFHRLNAHQNVLQVRAYTPKSLRILNQIYQNQRNNELAPLSSSSLWVKKSLPKALDLSALEQLVGKYVIEWTNPPVINIQRDMTYKGFTELFIYRDDIIKLLFTQIRELTIPLEVRDERIDGYLQDWLLSGKAQIAPRGTNLYVPPTPEQLLFFDIEVFTPLIKTARSEYQAGDWSDRGLEQLRLIAGAASTVGYGLIHYRQRHTNQDYLILEEKSEGLERRYWGISLGRRAKLYGSSATSSLRA